MTRKRTRFRFSDFLIILICTTVCAVSLWFFWKDLNTSTVRKDKDAIATVTFKYKIAQRRFSDSVVWERLQQDSLLYDADYIRTSDMAQASVFFYDGTKIDLHENTMLQVFFSEKGAEIAVDNGNIDVDSTESENTVAISMENGSVINLSSGSKVTASTNTQSNQNSIQIKAGNAEVKDSKGNSEIIKKGESVEISSSGDVKKNLISVTSIASNMRLLNFEEDKETVPVQIEWNVPESEQNKKILVETSFDENFETINEIYEATGSSKVNVETPAGKIYWRVYEENQPAEAVSGKIVVDEVTKPVINNPLENASFTYRKDLPYINFNWTGNDFVSKYKLLVSKTPDMKNPVVETELQILQFSCNTLPEGEYYCQVVPYYELNNIGYSEPSEVSNFTITKQKELLPPKLSVPADRTKYSLTNEAANLSFMWKSDALGAKYTFQLSDDAEFANIKFTLDSELTKVVLPVNINSLKEGAYYWRILRNSPEDFETSISDTRTILVEKYIPGENKLSYPPDNYSVEKDKLESLNFMWKLADEYKNKQLTTNVQFAADKSFTKNVKEISADSTELSNVQLSIGNYYWRIKVDCPDYSDKPVYSSIRKINILEPLGAVKFVQPKQNETKLIYGSQATKISWNKVAGADYYNLQIYNSSNELIKSFPSVVENSVNVELTSYSSDAETKYRCVIQPVTEATDLNSSRVGNVSEVTFGLRNPRPVTLVKGKESIDGLTALREPVVLNWYENDKAASSQFILKKQQSNGVMKVVETINNPAKQISLTRLTPGKYEWTVNANTESGIPLNAQKSYSFVITDLPVLAQPVLTEPQNRFVINQAYLKKNRTISFAWNKVSGATDYTFVIYKKNDNGTLKKIYEEKNLKSAEIKIKNLTIFDSGNFEWQVTAYCHAADGFEELKSNTAARNFEIDIKKPSAVKTVEQKVMYGE